MLTEKLIKTFDNDKKKYNIFSMRVLDLFSGIGGFSVGLERAGFETVAFCEQDSNCQKVLKQHWPDTPIFSNVETLNYMGDPLGGELTGDFDDYIATPDSIDVICGGFPCQDISVAGKGLGLQGQRSGLWVEYKRLINEIKPKYVIIENVANLRSKGLVTVLQDLWSLGYDAEWHIISACSIGAVHRRERIWILAYPPRQLYTGAIKAGQQGERAKGRSPLLVRQYGEKTNASDPYKDGRISGLPISTEHEKESLQSGRDGEKEHASNSDSSGKRGYASGAREENASLGEYRFNSKRGKFAPYPNDVRLGPGAPSPKKESVWRTEAAARFRPLFASLSEIEPTVCRKYDGLRPGLDIDTRRRRADSERVRRVKELIKSIDDRRVESVKQLGNSIVPQIAQLIGEAIKEYEEWTII